jgi:hypothetical protein
MMISFVVHAGSGGAGGAVIPFVVIGFIVLAVLIRLASGSTDDGRIRENIEQQGGKIQSINWSPFGRGWFGSKNERIYEVVYEDAQGKVHQAYCKTSMFSGVYWTEDKIVDDAGMVDSQSSRDPGTGAAAADLIAENQRLKAELERLKRP